jgi:NIMA (never in mitosis gene a)-related kinase
MRRYGRMNEKEKSMLVSEVNILRELKHPNIVRYKVCTGPTAL